jgi:hypothetical protein
MAQIQSNLDQVFKDILGKLNTDVPDKILREVATEIYENSVDRIFNKGLNTDYRKIGKYAKSTKILRARRGLQTTYVDLTFTGYLKSIYKLKKTSKGYNIVFTELYGKRISGFMEDHFRCKIFGLTDKDVRLANKTISDYVKKINAKKK